MTFFSMPRVCALLLGMTIMGNALAGVELDAKSFGAVGDGKKDDTAALQKALDQAAKAGGGTVLLPVGNYLTSGSLTVPSGVTLQGSWQSPHHADVVFGSAIFVAGGCGEGEGAAAAIELQPSSCVKGLTFFYPEQNSAAVTPYPYTIRGRGMHASVEDVTLVNSFRGIDFASHPNELHYVRNVFGCVLSRGVSVDQCTDIGRIENVHFNPHYWFRCAVPAGCPKPTPEQVISYMNANLDAFVFGRTDWEYVLNTFAFGYRTCYKFIATPHGAANGNFLGIGADGGQFSIWAEATQPMGVQITNGEFVAMAGEDSTQIVTTPSFHGVLQLNNCAFWGPSHRIARLEGPGSVNFSQCNFIDCSKGNPSDAAFKVDAGALQVANCRIAVAKHTHFELGEKASSAIITGTIFNKPLKLVSSGKAKVIQAQNIDPNTPSGINAQDTATSGTQHPEKTSH